MMRIGPDMAMSYDMPLASGPGLAAGVAVLLIADPGPGAIDAAASIAAAGARLLDTIGWDAVAARLGSHAARAILLVEAENVAPGSDGGDRIADLLPRIDTYARSMDVPVIVALDDAQIDLIAGTLFGPRTQLLCRPIIAERIAALTLAAVALDPHSLHDASGSSEAARLQRLNQEVARIADVLARLTQPDRAEGTGFADRRLGFDAGGGGLPPVDPHDVRQAIKARRLRDQFFDGGLFEDPAWDMLLDLFAADLERTQVSVSSLCIAAAVAPTTALRWIAKMSEGGLLERHPDPSDRRRAYLALSERARSGMNGYYAALARAGLGGV